MQKYEVGLRFSDNCYEFLHILLRSWLGSGDNTDRRPWTKFDLLDLLRQSRSERGPGGRGEGTADVVAGEGGHLVPVHHHQVVVGHELQQILRSHVDVGGSRSLFLVTTARIGGDKYLEYF